MEERVENESERGAEEHLAGSPSIELLLEDYRLKADFLKAHFDRLWKRFEVFLAIESALFAFFFKFLLTGEGTALRPNAWIFAALGLASTLVGIFFGAQDRYLVNTYRRSLRIAGRALSEWQSGKFKPSTWSGTYTPVGAVAGVPELPGAEPAHPLVEFKSPLEWHTRFASTTMLPTLFALATTVLWIVTLARFT
jgi:hypothetical protein